MIIAMDSLDCSSRLLGRGSVTRESCSSLVAEFGLPIWLRSQGGWFDSNATEAFSALITQTRFSLLGSAKVHHQRLDHEPANAGDPFIHMQEHQQQQLLGSAWVGRT